MSRIEPSRFQKLVHPMRARLAALTVENPSMCNTPNKHSDMLALLYIVLMGCCARSEPNQGWR
jgi:hypothetical protein